MTDNSCTDWQFLSSKGTLQSWITQSTSKRCQDRLLHHPYLDTINVIVDPDLLVLCCQICQVALPPSQMPSHIGNAHSAVQVDDDRYCQAVADMKIVSTLPPSVVGGRHRTAYQGLMIHDGLACDSCAFTCGARDWMAKHHRDKHPTSPCLSDGFRARCSNSIRDPTGNFGE
jgi:hypothetical protein